MDRQRYSVITGMLPYFSKEVIWRQGENVACRGFEFGLGLGLGLELGFGLGL